MKINYKQYGCYLIRWQMSTPILAACLMLLKSLGSFTSTIIANFIGGLIFFWVDKFIFTSKTLLAQWQVQENIPCVDCGRLARGYRLVKSANYDRTKAQPKFRCETCSQLKSERLRQAGVKI